jgi:hypothetical protein
LHDLTKGNYRVLRTVGYPEYSDSLIKLNVTVRAVTSSEWITDITISGTYTGPTEIILCKEYQLKWISTGRSILELGASVLETSSGKTVRQVWSSIITPRKTAGKFAPAMNRFPASGELINATISPFVIDGNKMQYEWNGTVAAVKTH